MRPLESHFNILLEKYQHGASEADETISNLQTKIQIQKEKLDCVTKTRSSLKKAFDDLNARKSKRSGLLASLNGLEVQGTEVTTELAELFRRIEAIGEVKFEPQRLAEIESALDKLEPVVQECNSLAMKLEELPRKEAERTELGNEKEGLVRELEGIARQIEALGYAESDYTSAKKILAEMKQDHDRYVSLFHKVQEIPKLEENISLRKPKLDMCGKVLAELEKAIKELGFDPMEHDGLIRERRSLSEAEEKAQLLRFRIASEPEILERLKDVQNALKQLELELDQSDEELRLLNYNSEKHEETRHSLAESEMVQEVARKEAANRKINLGVLEAEMARLKGEALKKKDYELNLSSVSRRIEVVDTTRSLVNRFMDQVLIRVKNDIARTAGDILEEVSGKYSRLLIDDDFNICVEDGGRYYPISRYSGGEVDMIAVSVRVAISEYLMRFGPEGENYSFIILDEVFGSQDLEHREKMINMLRSLEERFPQIIAISHFSDVQGQFDNTINVIEDEMGNSRVEVV